MAPSSKASVAPSSRASVTPRGPSTPAAVAPTAKASVAPSTRASVTPSNRASPTSQASVHSSTTGNGSGSNPASLGCNPHSERKPLHLTSRTWSCSEVQAGQAALAAVKLEPSPTEIRLEARVLMCRGLWLCPGFISCVCQEMRREFAELEALVAAETSSPDAEACHALTRCLSRLVATCTSKDTQAAPWQQCLKNFPSGSTSALAQASAEELHAAGKAGVARPGPSKRHVEPSEPPAKRVALLHS